VVLQVISQRERAIEGVLLGDHADAALHAGAFVRDVQTEDAGRSRGRTDPRRADAHDRRLARSVRSEQPEHLPGCHLEIDAIDRAHRR